jgi:hypothetical protein
VLWERCYRLAPEAVTRFALGLWRHQIADAETVDFSRHAGYAEHNPSRGHQFPRHGGFYISTWSAVYEHTRNSDLLDAIERTVTSYENRRNRVTGSIPSDSTNPELTWPMVNLSLAIDLHESATRMPDRLASRMRLLATSQDEVFLKIRHDLSPGGKGFVKAAITSTLEPGDWREKTANRSLPQWYPYSRPWTTGYGMVTDAGAAMVCLLRYRQVKLAGYRRLYLQAAERYLTAEPDYSISLFPGALGESIAILLGAYSDTGERKYLDRADWLGSRAIGIFFDGSPLPRASSRHNHYEAITLGDTLAMQLLDLWRVRNKNRYNGLLVWTDR